MADELEFYGYVVGARRPNPVDKPLVYRLHRVEITLTVDETYFDDSQKIPANGNGQGKIKTSQNARKIQSALTGSPASEGIDGI